MLVWLLALNALFLLPNLALTGPNPWLSLEALVIWALLCGAGGQTRRRLALGLAMSYGALTLLVVVDALIRESFGRGLNLYLEIGLLDSAWHLLTTNAGGPTALLGVAMLAAALAGIGWQVYWMLQQIGQRSTPALQKPLWLITGLVAAGAVTPWIGSPAVAFVANQASLITHTHQTREAFSQRLDAAQWQAAQPLPGLAGKDVILGFIESYGLTVLTEPSYRRVVDPALHRLTEHLDQAGLSVATGRLASPIQGGQSWLGHLSVLSGQWVENQLAYETLLSSRHATLIDDFRATGHQTVAVMPAITGPWPEGRLFGYDRIFDHQALGYQGPAFNWVTMPDQYTWRRFQTIREQTSQPLFAELALISSHAPWVPILPVLTDWEGLEEGRAFQPWAGSGEAPVSLWRDKERVRQHFAQAIRYALDTAGQFAGRYLGQDSLLILLGDHQPAPLITGDKVRRDVMVHVISADPSLVEPFLNGELPGFQPGVRPDLATEGAPMSHLRPFLARHFGSQSSMAYYQSSDKPALKNQP